MIRHVSVFTLKPDADIAQMDEGLRIVCDLVPGILSSAYGRDLGLREGNGGYATSFDFEDETAYRAWVEKALEADDPDVSDVRPERPEIRLDDAAARTVAELTAQLRAQREITLDLIQGMTPEQFDRTASQPMFGRLTVMQWLRSYYRHDRMHRDQMAGRDPGYKPKFVGGEEPDQRRGPRI